MTALDYFAPQLSRPSSRQLPAPPGLACEGVPLHAVVVYDRRTAGMRGLEFLQRISAEGDAGIRLCPKLWRLDVISDPASGTEFRDDLIQADMVVFAMDDAENRSTCNAPWFLACHSLRTRTLPLVVMLTEVNARALEPMESRPGRAA